MAVQSFTRSADRVIALLVELHRGVYLVGAVPAPHTHEMAGLLACGPDTVLSHRSAAALWALLPYAATAPVQVTISPARYVCRPGIRTHRTPIAVRDIRRREGMRVSSPPRVVLELAADLELETLELVVAEANYRRRTRSRGERRLLRALRAAGIEGYEVNGKVHGFEVDFLWRDLGFAARNSTAEGLSRRKRLNPSFDPEPLR